MEETFTAGQKAVEAATNGETDKMVCFIRESDSPYSATYGLTPLTITANAEKRIPLDWITADGTGLNDKFTAYALPLIQGEPTILTEMGIPKHISL